MACRAPSRLHARSETFDEHGRDLRRHCTASPADAGCARVLPAVVPRLSRRRRAAPFARPAAGLVGPPPRARALPATRLLRRAAGTTGQRRTRPRRGAPGPPARRPGPPAGAPADVRMVVQSPGRLLLLERRRPRARRAGARGHEHAVGRAPLVRHRRPQRHRRRCRRAHRGQGHARVALPARRRRL